MKTLKDILETRRQGYISGYALGTFFGMLVITLTILSNPEKFMDQATHAAWSFGTLSALFFILELVLYWKLLHAGRKTK